MGKKSGSRFLSLAQVGKELGCSQSQVYAFARTGALPAIKFDGRGHWRVERAALEEFIARSYAETQHYVSAHPYGPADELTDGMIDDLTDGMTQPSPAG